jgi:hypothetical protein
VAGSVDIIILVGEEVDAFPRPLNIWWNDDDDVGFVENDFDDNRADEDNDVLPDDDELCDCLRALARRFWNHT